MGNPNYNIQMDEIKDKPKINTGRWTQDEHERFIEAILKYGNEWKKVERMVKTRTAIQSRSHAQKFFLRLKKKLKLDPEKKFTTEELNSFPPHIIAESLNGINSDERLTRMDMENLSKIIKNLQEKALEKWQINLTNPKKGYFLIKKNGETESVFYKKNSERKNKGNKQ
jgi:SHAQKYF class myb-like DNA-binding protein